MFSHRERKPSERVPEIGIFARLDLDPAEIRLIPWLYPGRPVVEHEIALVGLDHQNGVALARARGGDRDAQRPRRPALGDQVIALVRA